MKSQPSITVLRSILGSKVVSYHSVFARALRSVPAGVMLSQGFFWQENAQFRELKQIDGKPFFTATAAEWYEATGVTDDQQLTSRDILRSSGFWLEKRAGLPAKLYFHIDLDILVSVIYGFLQNGKQVSVDTRHKNREITRASDGKFRQPVSVKYGNNIKEESTLESFESTSREGGDGQKNSDSKKTKKAPPVPAVPPVLFSDSEFAGRFDRFETQFQIRFPDVVPDTVDLQHYFKRCTRWSHNRGAVSTDWIQFAADIINDDRQKGKLITPKPLHDANSGSNSPNQSGPGQSSANPAGFDRDAIAASARRVVEGYSRKNRV